MTSSTAASPKDAPLADIIHLTNPFTILRPQKTTRYLVVMLPGNPGVIEFYRSFMTHLFARLQVHQVAGGVTTVEVMGWSMAGFEVAAGGGGDEAASGAAWDTGDEDEAKAGKAGKAETTPPCKHKGGQRHRRRWLSSLRPLSLQSQVEHMEARLREVVGQMEKQGVAPKVILMGHSVGSYILLEIIRRHRKRLEEISGRRAQGSEAKDSDGQEPLLDASCSSANGHLGEPDLVGGICLFPTVAQLAMSESGKGLSRLAKIPYLPFVVGCLLKFICWVIPASVLQFIARKKQGMGKENSKIIAAWLKRGGGLHHSIVLGCDELKNITSDKWDEEVWGAIHPSPTKVPRSRLFFYFGENDHWVAKRTRNDLMRVRGRGEKGDEWKPWMEIDKLEIPHAFCLEHSVPVADQVAEYIDTIIKLGDDAKKEDHSLAKNRLSSKLNSQQ